MLRLTYLSGLAFVMVACSPAPTERTGTVGSSLTGPIEMRVAEDADDDAPAVAPPPATSPTHIVVTVARVEALIDEGKGADDGDDAWTTLSLTPRTVDLLALPTGGFVSLGVTRLPAGGIERLRLFLNPLGPSYVVTADGLSHALVVPSGAIKVIGDFDAEGCAVGQVTLAFAGRNSIEAHPPGDDFDGFEAGRRGPRSPRAVSPHAPRPRGH